MNEQYPRGSEWRRWEMHLHTPFTKKGDRFTGSTYEEKWSDFYASILEYVGDGSNPIKAICAIAITDYLSIENYLTVREARKLPECVKLLLPNVELRIVPVARDAPINIHCIFSPEIADELHDRFFAKLEIKCNGTKYSATRSQLICMGRDYTNNNQLPENEALEIALGQYVLEYTALSKVFEDDPVLRDNTIIVVSNKSNDGVSGAKSNKHYRDDGNVSQLDTYCRSIYQLADMIFSGNPSEIAHFLGRKPSDDADSIKHKYGKLMPCIHGSDAHTNGDIFEPDGKRYCWIKADPTFEGFKQVCYEPDGRVHIGSSYPDQKQGYHVIDRIEIVGNAEFSPEPILFCDKLTCIIGGKSTGKSLLLHNIALAIDPKQVEKKAETVKTKVQAIPQLKVFWRDGTCSCDGDETHKVVYIPQTYLNRLSDEKEETTEIDNIIESIVLQDADAHLLFENMKANIASHRNLVRKTIVDLIQIVTDRNRIVESKKEIGTVEGINHEIQQLTSQLEQLWFLPIGIMHKGMQN